MFNQQLQENPLETRQDYVDALRDILDPVYKLMDSQHTPGRVHISDSGSGYDRPRRDIEGFMRTLWGIGPLCSTEERAAANKPLFNLAIDGIIAGTDPTSDFYWGELNDYDQLFVEMGSLATMLILTKESFWNLISEKQQQNIYNWLNQINHHTLPPTNWLFFRVLVNTFFYDVGLPVDLEAFEKDLDRLDSYYLKDGWYFDGYPNQIDYYIAFGMQYYGVLSASLAKGEITSHKNIFEERAGKFAHTFKNWFTKTGAALPFGRSLTYRFAQSGFWAVSAYAGIDLDGVSLSEVKYLLSKNMNYWFKQAIFTEDGLLTIGYAYPDLVMAEGYNAPGSPYWAMKNFIVLALPDDAKFWSVSPSVPEFALKELNPYSRMLLIHNTEGTELQAFTAGQHSHEHAHGESKYEKYVYSTTFGFSVKKDSLLPNQGAFDSTLAVSETDYNYQTVFGYKEFQIHDQYVYSLWQPWPNVSIKNFVIPDYPWHIRVHIIESDRTLNFYEGSFSAPAEGERIQETNNSVFYHSSAGMVGVESLSPGTKTELASIEPNTNLLFQRTVLPIIKGSINQGHSTLVSLYLGNAFSDNSLPECPNVTFHEKEGTLEIKTGSEKRLIVLNELR